MSNLILKKHCSEPWISAIKDGRKTVEGRLDKEIWSSIQPSTTVIFFNNELSIEVQVIVTDVHKAKTFKELYEMFGEKLVPSTCLESEVLNKYKKTPWMIYDTIDDYKNALNNGTTVVGIEFVTI
jgi:ASC-1-like (ASCH) protein